MDLSPFQKLIRIAHALDHDEIKWLVREYGESTRIALDEGVDAVEIHANHDDVVQWFLSPLTNVRTDGYGGPIEARMRFALEVFRAVRAVWPERKPIGVRISSTDWADGGWEVDDSVVLARALRDLGCDFYAITGHKLYGPTGIGALWARAELLDAMPPYQGGGSMIDRVSFEKTTYAPAPTRFEAGTPHIVGALGFHAAIDYVDAIGLDRIHAHETALVAKTREALSRINSIRVLGPEDSAGIVSFAMEGVHPHDIGTILDESRVAIRAGHHCAQPLMKVLGVPATARASFAAYSTLQDVERLADGVRRAGDRPHRQRGRRAGVTFHPSGR